MTAWIHGFALLLGLGFAGQAWAGDYSPRTGDSWVDGQLGELNSLAGAAREQFIDEMVDAFGAPRYLVNELLDTRHWVAGDVYYACALAYQLRRPCTDVARAHEQDRTRGWGELARELGIRPGSKQFQALKSLLGKTSDRLKPQPAAAPGKDRQ